MRSCTAATSEFGRQVTTSHAARPLLGLPKTGEGERLARPQRVVKRPAVAPFVEAVGKLDAASRDGAAPRRNRFGANVDAAADPPTHLLDGVAPVVADPEHVLRRRDVIARKPRLAELRVAKLRKRGGKRLRFGERESAAHTSFPFAISERSRRCGIIGSVLKHLPSLFIAAALACAPGLGIRSACRGGSATLDRRPGFLDAWPHFGFVRFLRAGRGAERPPHRPDGQRRTLQRARPHASQLDAGRAPARCQRRSRSRDGH